MSEIALSAYSVGIDQLSDETALRPGAVRDAVNVDFDGHGLARRRPGATRIEAGRFHSLWRGKSAAYCVRNDELCRVSAAGVQSIFTLSNSAHLYFTELADRVVVSNMGWIGEILPDDTVRGLGVEDGSLSDVQADLVGGLAAGRYAVAVSSLRDHEEGGLSRPKFVEVPEGGGIRLIFPMQNDSETTGVRIYRTLPYGDVLYHSIDFAAGLTSLLIGNTPIGRAADNSALRRTLPGNFVCTWRGHLLLARGRTVYFTVPLRYGLYSPRTGFVQEGSTIRMIAPVDGGVFVGTRAGVVFYRGNNPKEWSRTELGAAPPIPGTYRSIDTSFLNPEFQIGSTAQAALWLSPAGYVVGLPDGSLVQPHARRMALSAQHGHTAVYDRRAVTLVQ
jgi:hypothetical protein